MAAPRASWSSPTATGSGQGTSKITHLGFAKHVGVPKCHARRWTSGRWRTTSPTPSGEHGPRTVTTRPSDPKAGSVLDGRWRLVRKIAEGAVRVNDTVVEDANAVLTAASLTDQQLIKLSLGKKRHALLRIAN